MENKNKKGVMIGLILVVIGIAMILIGMTL